MTLPRAAGFPPPPRYFLPGGRLGFLIDGDREAMLSHTVEGKKPRYVRGPYRPAPGKVIFG
jgi:hypothetical protein